LKYVATPLGVIGYAPGTAGTGAEHAFQDTFPDVHMAEYEQLRVRPDPWIAASPAEI
jgi:hypothetical protein